MLGLNRDSVLKSFLEKVKEAKRLNMKDVKMTMKEMDDLFQVVYELMSEQISNAIGVLENKREQDIIRKAEPVLPKKRRVIEEIKVEKEPVIVKSEQVSNQVTTQVSSQVSEQVKPTVVVQQPPKIQPIPMNVVEEEPEEEEDDDNSLYGGTW